MDLLTWAGLIAAGVKLVSLAKQIWPTIPPWGVQLLAWAVSIGLMLVASTLPVLQDTEINGISLGLMPIAGLLGLGFIGGATGSLVGADLVKAVDNNGRANV